MFRLLKLRPPNGWNSVYWELTIVTLGVLIALGAQQLVESIDTKAEVAQLRGAIRAELADDRARWEDMRAADRCTLFRLGALERWAATAPAGARLEQPYRLMIWNMHSDAWDIAKTSPVAGNIPLDERLTYADLYASIDNMRDRLAEERINAIDLSALIASTGQAAHRQEIALHVAKARTFLRRRAENYPYLFTRFDALKIRPDRSKLTIARDPKALCEPLPT
jgi:hypothetical protein